MRFKLKKRTSDVEVQTRDGVLTHYWFVLVARDGEVLATSAFYPCKAAAFAGIGAIACGFMDVALSALERLATEMPMEMQLHFETPLREARAMVSTHAEAWATSPALAAAIDDETGEEGGERMDRWKVPGG